MVTVVPVTIEHRAGVLCIPVNSAGRSGRKRPPIPVEIGHLIRPKSDTPAGRPRVRGWGWVVAPEVMGHEASCQVSIP